MLVQLAPLCQLLVLELVQVTSASAGANGNVGLQSAGILMLRGLFQLVAGVLVRAEHVPLTFWPPIRR